MQCACEIRDGKVVSFCGAHVEAVRNNIHGLKNEPPQRPESLITQYTESEILAKIANEAREMLDYYESDEYHEDNDLGHYLVETVLQTIYGKDVYDWINKVTD